MTPIIARLVEFSRRRAGPMAAAILALAFVAAVYVARHISIDSDTGKLVDPNLPWQKAAADVDRQFPENHDLLVAVVDGQTAEQAADGAAALAQALKRRPELFHHVRQPDADPYF